MRINGKKFEDLKDEDDGTFSPGSWLGTRALFSGLLSDREVEPFDEALDRETWSLYNQRLQWDLELATKRRNRPREVSDLLENLFKVQDAALGELDKPVEGDEDRPDTSLPDGQLVVQLACQSLTFGSQKVCSLRRAVRSPRWLLYPRVYTRCVSLHMPSQRVLTSKQTVKTQHERLQRLQDIEEEVNTLKS